MESNATIAGRALHQQLIVFPLGLLATAVVFDVLRLLIGRPGFAVASYYMIGAGVLAGLLAAVFGLIDYLAIPAGTRAKRVGLLHGVGNVWVVVLFAVSWLLRSDQPRNVPTTLPLVLALVGAAIAVGTGWLGGELVGRLGVGVDPDANLNASASYTTRVRLARGIRVGGAMVTISDILQSLGRGANRSPLHTLISADHIISPKPSTVPEEGSGYFTVTVDEIRLGYDRRWWSRVAPMVYVLTSFSYDGANRDLPVIVGPSLLQAPGQAPPTQLSFRDIRVAGPHPFAGGVLSLTVVLYEVPMSSTAQAVLDAVDTTTRALPFATDIIPYLSLANAIFAGLGALLQVGDTLPVVGCRHDIGDEAAQWPAVYFALVADPAVSASDLWVVDGQLHHGTDASTAQPLRTSDFVLYSARLVSRRSDARQLPFIRPLWERVVRFASIPDDASWLTAKTNMTTLGQELSLSPDLTRAQAQEMYGSYLADMIRLRKEALERAHLGAAVPLDEEAAILRNIAMSVMRVG